MRISYRPELRYYTAGLIGLSVQCKRVVIPPMLATVIASHACGAVKSLARIIFMGELYVRNATKLRKMQQRFTGKCS